MNLPGMVNLNVVYPEMQIPELAVIPESTLCTHICYLLTGIQSQSFLYNKSTNKLVFLGIGDPKLLGIFLSVLSMSSLFCLSVCYCVVCLFVMSVCLSVCLFVYQYVCMSLCLAVSFMVR